MAGLCTAGTASVIIALTDGELNDWQFDTAQREVSATRGGRPSFSLLASHKILHFFFFLQNFIIFYLHFILNLI